MSKGNSLHSLLLCSAFLCCSRTFIHLKYDAFALCWFLTKQALFNGECTTATFFLMRVLFDVKGYIWVLQEHFCIKKLYYITYLRRKLIFDLVETSSSVLKQDIFDLLPICVESWYLTKWSPQETFLNSTWTTGTSPPLLYISYVMTEDTIEVQENDREVKA